MRKEKEWKEDCMKEDSKGRKGAEKIQDRIEKKEIIREKKQNSQYWLQAAENLINTNTPDAAIILGYFAAENKVEEVLARKNYKINTHMCAIKGLSRVLESPKLATQLDKLYQKRKDINYNTELGKENTEAKRVLEDNIKPLMQEIEEKINQES